MTKTLDCIRAQRNRPGSLIREFIDFLDDEALASFIAPRGRSNDVKPPAMSVISPLLTAHQFWN